MVKIKNDAQLCNYTTHQIEDAGIDDTLDKEQYIGIKIDDYYMGLNMLYNYWGREIIMLGKVEHEN